MDFHHRIAKIQIQPTTAIAEKTVRLFLSSKTVVFSDNLSTIVVVSAIVVSAIAVVCCISVLAFWR